MERVVADRLVQAGDPLLLLLLGRGRHPVDGVLTFHHLTLAVGFARLDDVGPAAGVQLEAVRFAPVRYLAHLQRFGGKEGRKREFKNKEFKLIGCDNAMLQYNVDLPQCFPME